MWRHNFISKYFYFKKPNVTNFADITKNSTVFTKATFEGQKKIKSSKIYALECNLYLYFLIF